ncbi:MAG TPA: hypothetical protein V6C58_14010 [Allocoleopsis sp.]
MANKIKIPSKYVLVIKHYVYKGHYGIILERTDKRGNFVRVLLESTGTKVIIPIDNLAFINPDGNALHYVKDRAMFVLEPYPIKGISKNTLAQKSKLFILPVSKFTRSKTSKDIFEFRDKVSKLTYEEVEFDTDATKEIQSKLSALRVSDPERELIAGYANLAHIRENAPLNKANVFVELISVISNILGLNYDNTSINIHAENLSKAISSPYLEDFVLTELTTKLLCISYIFLHMNNIGISIPISYSGCKKSPIDDFSEIVCICKKTGFIGEEQVEDSIFRIVSKLTKVFDTSILPSFPNYSERLTKERKQIISKILSVPRKPTISKKTFIKPKTYIKLASTLKAPKLNQIERSVADRIISKLKELLEKSKIEDSKSKISKEERKGLEFVIKNFDKLVRQKNYMILLGENKYYAKVWEPILKEFNREVNEVIEKGKEIKKETISESSSSIKRQIIEDYSRGLENYYNSLQQNDPKREIYKYIITNIYNIVNLDPSELNSMSRRTNLSIFSTDFDKERLNYIISIRNEVRKTINETITRENISSIIYSKISTNKKSEKLKTLNISQQNDIYEFNIKQNKEFMENMRKSIIEQFKKRLTKEMVKEIKSSKIKHSDDEIIFSYLIENIYTIASMSRTNANSLAKKIANIDSLSVREMTKELEFERKKYKAILNLRKMMREKIDTLLAEEFFSKEFLDKDSLENEIIEKLGNLNLEDLMEVDKKPRSSKKESQIQFYEPQEYVLENTKYSDPRKRIMREYRNDLIIEYNQIPNTELDKKIALKYVIDNIEEILKMNDQQLRKLGSRIKSTVSIASKNYEKQKLAFIIRTRNDLKKKLSI